MAGVHQEMSRTERDIGHGDVTDVSHSVGAKPWIKIRCDLWDDPRVSRISDLIGQSEATVVGALVRLWSLADLHSTDGRLSYTHATIDRKVGVVGFADAAATVGWLDTCDTGVLIPRFDKHNGASARQRAQAADRKRRQRSGKSVEIVSRTERDKNATRLDKIRIDEMSLEKSKLRPDRTGPARTGPDRTEQDAQEPGRAGPAEVFSKMETQESHSTKRPKGRSFGDLIDHECLDDLRTEVVKPDPGKLTGGVFAHLLRPQMERGTESHWLQWYRQQLGSLDPVLRRGTLAEAAVSLAAVYAARRVPQTAIRSSRLALWISWVKSEDGSQISDEHLKQAAGIVREARSKAREKAGAA